MGRGSVGGVVRRHVQLDPVPESARLARRAVTDALHEAGCAELADAAALLVSELVTNAILHARTAIEVVVAASPSGVRIGVNDHSPHLPARRDYGRGATTGRGLEMLELVATEHGTDSHDDGSKTVWFELGGTQNVTPHDEGADAAPAPPGVRVVLLATPWRLARAWQQHADALLRESLLACWETGGDLDSQLGELNAAGEAFAEMAAALDGAAIDSPVGHPATGAHVDLAMDLSAGAGASFAAMGRALDNCAELAEAGLLLAPPTQPEMRLFRRWICDEVSAQAAGAAPAGWEGLPSETVPSSTRPVEWDRSRVNGAAEALVAADDANRIVAASAAALALLGWTPEELIGRRIVSLIPARLREEHVAAFTDHLLTGVTTILDRQVQVPALCADGTELPVYLQVTREQAGGGRSVFVAAFRAVEPA